MRKDRPDPVTQQPALSTAEVVRRAFDWVASVAVPVGDGLAWLENGVLVDELYSGTAGVLLACADVTAVGFDVGEVAAGALARLLSLIGEGADEDVTTMPDDGLFTGWAGVATALRAWSDVAGDGAPAAATLTARIAERVLRPAPDTDWCTDIISGGAGTLIALLADDSDIARRAADVLADRLVATAEPAPSGLHWRMTPDRERLMPGFSHGTAGAAYALVAAGRTLDRPDLLTVAVRGAEALLAVGETPKGWAVPATIPRQSHRPPVNYGWCHGPTGTIRLFLALDQLDPQPRWRRAVDGCLQALRDSRLPARLYPGYWDNVARCCGTAGVGALLVERCRATGEETLLGWADTLAADVIARAEVSAAGTAWSNTEHTRVPPALPPEPGFMQGAAGIAAWLAGLDALHTGHDMPPSSTGPDPSWV